MIHKHRGDEMGFEEDLSEWQAEVSKDIYGEEAEETEAAEAEPEAETED